MPSPRCRHGLAWHCATRAARAHPAPRPRSSRQSRCPAARHRVAPLWSAGRQETVVVGRRTSISSLCCRTRCQSRPSLCSCKCVCSMARKSRPRARRVARDGEMVVRSSSHHAAACQAVTLLSTDAEMKLHAGLMKLVINFRLVIGAPAAEKSCSQTLSHWWEKPDSLSTAPSSRARGSRALWHPHHSTRSTSWPRCTTARSSTTSPPSPRCKPSLSPAASTDLSSAARPTPSHKLQPRIVHTGFHSATVFFAVVRRR